MLPRVAHVATGQDVSQCVRTRFFAWGAPSLPREEISVHFDTGPLKRRKSLNFAPGKHSSKERIFMPRGRALRDLPVRLTGKRLYPELRVWPSGLSVPRGFRLVPAGHQPVLRDAEAAVFFAVSYKSCPACKVSFQTDAYLSQPHFGSGIFPRPASALPLATLCRLLSQVLSAFIVTHVRVSVFGSG